uniref:Putative glycosyl hydrolase family5 n=1 Tax=uncultured symbiotic protist of Hodotermopsis sjoestedti TaxID=403659 RepID=A4UWS1_9EUKA|nr:putative glycosyl hydrolase family5 [uncultured symbiotic protist of Hodotermopsis sjoestedti]
MQGLILLLAGVLSADWLHVDGTAIVNEAGEEVFLTGLNWFGFETDIRVIHGLWQSSLHTIVKEAAAHGFNVWRIPVSADTLGQWRDGEEPLDTWIDPTANPDLQGLGGFEIFNIFLDDCRANGMKVFVDIHNMEPGPQNPFPYEPDHPGDPPEYYYGVLEWLTKQYLDDDVIIGIDLFNEPHSVHDCGDPQTEEDCLWDDSEKVNNFRYVASEAGKRILAINPNLLIIIELPGCYHGGFGWWGGTLQGVGDVLADLPATNVVYSPHEYGLGVWNSDAEWLKPGFTYDSLMEKHWLPHWLFVKKDGIAPVLIGEWGGTTEGENANWIGFVADLIGKEGLSHTYWDLNPDSSGTGGLLLDDWATWDEEKLGLIAPSLTGKLWPTKEPRGKVVKKA